MRHVAQYALTAAERQSLYVATESPTALQTCATKTTQSSAIDATNHTLACGLGSFLITRLDIKKNRKPDAFFE